MREWKVDPTATHVSSFRTAYGGFELEIDLDGSFVLRENGLQVLVGSSIAEYVAVVYQREVTEAKES
jgi:hypothetical protein